LRRQRVLGKSIKGPLGRFHLNFLDLFPKGDDFFECLWPLSVRVSFDEHGISWSVPAASQPTVDWLSLAQSPGKTHRSVLTTNLTNLGAAIGHLRVSWDGFWEECEA
jgi:hypothetical protein